jgi:hypothetical protein
LDADVEVDDAVIVDVDFPIVVEVISAAMMPITTSSSTRVNPPDTSERRRDEPDGIRIGFSCEDARASEMTQVTSEAVAAAAHCGGRSVIAARVLARNPVYIELLSSSTIICGLQSVQC